MKRMLFNATHQEELRVAIVEGQKLIDLDIETAGREQRKGNIYKGVVTRVEPSLEACFVNYGEDRHGFLPFKEISRAYFKEGVDARSARVQDAITEGQSLIIQVEKEERGNKGAALTTFISLAGRYLVLMPNNPRGGGVSRRVEGEERQELRETMEKLAVPVGMSLIARTAGIGRNVEELQWDLNYLMQLWTAIDTAAKDNVAPILIYLESSLVIRAIRDYFSPDIGEVLIDTDDIFEQAQAFMSVVMPDNLHRVKQYRDDVPLFSRFQIEHQIETAYGRNVPLPSGGAIVIDHTEALVAVDVNSARSTRGSDIEETALRTNLEAADEVARQLRLRDLGGLIVIDFIDMEDNKNQRAVEMRLRDALHHDRARVQMGKISRFGLMELSRQRLRPALNEGSHITCPRCTGTGVIRDTESSALHVIRLIQEESMKENTAAIHAQVPVDVATYLLNEKRSDIAKMEARLKVNIVLIPNKYIETPHHQLDRLRHDDPRLELPRASFELAEGKEDDSVYAKREEDLKTRPQAVVKGITPTQPAPQIQARSTGASGADKGFGLRVPSDHQAGLINRILGWFRRGNDSNNNTLVSTSSTTLASSGQPAERGQATGSGNMDSRRRRNNHTRSNRSRTEERSTAPTTLNERLSASNTDAPLNETLSIEPSGLGTESGERSTETSRSRGTRGGRGRGRGNSEARVRREQSQALLSEDDDLPAAFFDTEITTAPVAETATTSQRGTGRRRSGGGRNLSLESSNLTALEEPQSSLSDGRLSDAHELSPHDVPSHNFSSGLPSLHTAIGEHHHDDIEDADDEGMVDVLTHPEGESINGEERPARRRRGRRGRRGGGRRDETGALSDPTEIDESSQFTAEPAFIPNEVLLTMQAQEHQSAPFLAGSVLPPEISQNRASQFVAPAASRGSASAEMSNNFSANQPLTSLSPENATDKTKTVSQVSGIAKDKSFTQNAAADFFTKSVASNDVVTTVDAVPSAETVDLDATPFIAHSTTTDVSSNSVPVSAVTKLDPPSLAQPGASIAMLKQSVEQAGLQWVETQHDKWMQTQLAIAALPKKPKVERIRRPAEPLDSRPLEQVETRQLSMH